MNKNNIKSGILLEIISHLVNRHFNSHHPVNKNKVLSSIAFFSYISKVTARREKVLHKNKVKTVFTLCSKISNILPLVKDKLNTLLSKGINENLVLVVNYISVKQVV